MSFRFLFFWAFVLSPCVVSCTAPEVWEARRPLVDTPLLATILNPSKISATTRQFLRQENLVGVYREDPSQAISALRDQLAEQPSPDQRLALVELCANTADRIAPTTPMEAVGFHLAAAELALPGALIRDGAGEGPELREAYNHSCGRVARLLFELRHSWTQPARIEGPGHTYRLTCRTTGEGTIDPRSFDDLRAAGFLRFRGIDLDRHTRRGFGAAMVGHRRRTEERAKNEPFLPPFGIARPVCATLDFTSGNREVELAFHEVMTVEKSRLAGTPVTLRADFTAPLALLHNFTPRHNVGLSGMLDPVRYRDQTGLFQFEPFRPDQIPVVVVHGLMSSPAAWVPAINALRADPELRKRYQLLAFYYPTGFPISYNAATLRLYLQKFREFHDHRRINPRMRRMLLAGHSMGGILSNAQIRDSGDILLDKFFEKPLADIPSLTNAQREAMENLLVYEANPDVTRAVFVAAPHRGSGFAANPIGGLGARLINFPMEVVTAGLVRPTEAMTPEGRRVLRRPPNSVRGLRPDMPLLAGILEQPVNARAVYHSVIARRSSLGSLENSGDGVVPYTSAHLESAASEKVVRASHRTVVSNAEAIEEMRRILYLHAGLPYAPPAASSN